MGWVVFGGSENKFIGYTYVVIVAELLVLLTVLAFQKLPDKYLCSTGAFSEAAC